MPRHAPLIDLSRRPLGRYGRARQVRV